MKKTEKSSSDKPTIPETQKKSISKKAKTLVKTASELIPAKGRCVKLLEAEKAVLEGRLAEVKNLLQQFNDIPELAKATDIMLNSFIEE